jgi:CTP synthase
VEVVPHIPLEVIRRIEEARVKAGANVVIIEIGGTVGEYQNMLFLEAARMMKIKHSRNVFFAMVSFLPIPSRIGEMKTKPTQHAVRTLNASGIQPDIIIARSKLVLDEKRKEKISMFCNIPVDRIISAPDVDSIYDIPINFEKEGLGDMICGNVGMFCGPKENTGSLKWKKFANKTHTKNNVVNIAIVGKYFNTGDFVLTDAYVSVLEAIKYSAYNLLNFSKSLMSAKYTLTKFIFDLFKLRISNMLSIFSNICNNSVSKSLLFNLPSVGFIAI